MEKPPNPREGFPCDLWGAASPAPSCQSVKSDRSMDRPIFFKGGSSSPDISWAGLACDLCTGKRRRAVKSCLTCTASYCETHVRQHYTVAVLQRHTLVEADGDQAPPPPGQIQFLAVRSDSVSLSWGAPEGMDSQTLSFKVTWDSGTEQRSLKVKGTHIDIQSLRPGKKYLFSVATVRENGSQSKCVSASVCTVIPPPVELTEESVDTTSLTLSWREPHGLDQTPHFLVSYSSPGTEPQFISTASHSTVLSNLQPGTEYTVRVCTVLENGGQSEATSKSVCTKLSPPGNLNISSVGETSVSLSWDRPTDMEGVPHTFRVTWGNSRGQRESFTTEENLTVLSQLRPGTEYSISVCTVLHSNGLESDPVCTTIQTEPSAPGRVRVEEVKSRSVRLRWDTPTEMEGVSYTFSISYSCDGEEPKEVMSGSNSNTTVLSDLRAGVEYSFSVSTVLHNGSRSRPSSAQAHTKPSAPGRVRVEEVRSRSVRLCWCKPSKMEGVSYTFSISYSCDGEEPKEVTTGSNSNTTVLSDLRAGVEYSFSVSTVLHNGSRSRPSSAQAHTKTCLEELVCDLGLKHHLKEKLTLSAVLEIDGETIRNETVGSLASLPWCFLKKLMMMNMTARSVRCAASQESASQDLDSMDDITSSEEFVVNPLDLVTALFLCSDSFFQQEMALKMSMCQFSVPLLLPNCDTQQPTLMLWAMRDIVKSFRPHSLAEQRGFVEGSIVLTELPLISFVRLGTSSLSKSQILNQVLSNPQQYHDTFIHHNMTGGNAPRRISDGLVEVSWYLPSGDMNSDIFPEPVAVANLRGDISAFAIQFSFLCQTSAAVFVFCDDLESNSEFLKAQNIAKQKADEITVRITDILLYKESQLPLQGEMCKELAKLEKEECRLKEAGDANIELYKSELCKKKQGLREKQRDHGVSDAMSRFISALSSPREQRSYFLKWLKINLDNLSLTHLSGLRQKYKELCQDSSENRGFITDLDRQISSSSLGVEHFLREMGQLYEATSSLPENHPSRQQMQNLPRLCAQLLLDGFPVELVDGDASNIPLQWMKAVLTELHSLTGANSKIRVVTVLGVQSSGKSTLLNTMFGVQFAVSSGRCTRGAFMLLIRLKKNFRKDLGCDFLMVIDTEGLKSPELAQLADSYEHDNELATLVVGLSDITIVNITMENCAEMKDILQIVVHAFLRMKEVGKKPCCHFVHQNVADVSAYEKNLRDRQLLLKQLNEMTHVAARMEGRTENKIFTDVMHYDPERNTWYIPGLWRGNPPMAPVNTGYSEAVKEFKSRMIEALKELKGTRPAHTIPEFLEWTESLWKAVKYENFIFSFQNSLVADAYTKLCTEFNKWEWAFRKHMHNWVTEAETRVSNFGTVTAQHASSLDDLLTNLQKKASFELDREEKQILDKVTEYFKRQEGHIYLVERYREEFMNSAKSLKKEMQPVVMMKLESAVDLKKAMAIVEDGKKNHKTIMEGMC
ncbi:hypothetical protein MATL_G00220630 [Megalops atlanticus]|uniref:Up-regulator of cell proliferation-like n=1 Tax=Megalops atlanticus TaxID=7932 RepID=A0A9D3PEL0_MEGAT|nr:hypothetical protein MATL_G00220630 [Megalops atlanticus]